MQWINELSNDVIYVYHRQPEAQIWRLETGSSKSAPRSRNNTYNLSELTLKFHANTDDLQLYCSSDYTAGYQLPQTDTGTSGWQPPTRKIFEIRMLKRVQSKFQRMQLSFRSRHLKLPVSDDVGE